MSYRDTPCGSFRNHMRVMWKDTKQPGIKADRDLLWRRLPLAVQGLCLTLMDGLSHEGVSPRRRLTLYLSAMPLKRSSETNSYESTTANPIVFQLLKVVAHDLGGWKLVRHTQREITALSTLMSSYNVVMVELIIQCPLVKGQVVVLDAHSLFVGFLGFGVGWTR